MLPLLLTRASFVALSSGCTSCTFEFGGPASTNVLTYAMPSSDFSGNRFHAKPGVSTMSSLCVVAQRGGITASRGGPLPAVVATCGARACRCAEHCLSLCGRACPAHSDLQWACALQVANDGSGASLASGANGAAGDIGRLRTSASATAKYFEVLTLPADLLNPSKLPSRCLLQGAMSNLMVWDRELGSSEISSLYSSHTYVLMFCLSLAAPAAPRSLILFDDVCRVPTSSLVVWLRFSESSGSTAADSSGQGNAATLSGGALFTQLADPLCLGEWAACSCHTLAHRAGCWPCSRC